ncbi:prepilin-type N-terminal cleavage/methylation domain-containing protein [Desertivirga xinjiangensis]|uniref:prepilin-type N-terminal cleavage/methylation domain-containing protein n=1 Tax=Desertivirga xinjiangensis TaxID=539206 RepID=UPI0021097B52|nr:prepilin-type N-terminal cleavage/methylation domain-containing protein [Pedobacter xinjiangensis]
MSSVLKHKLKAYTLTEILIVLVIIGILVLLALPNLLPLITKAKSTEAKVQLEHLHTLEKNYFFEKSKYSTDLNELGFIQEKLSTDSKDGRANYRIEVSQSSPTTSLSICSLLLIVIMDTIQVVNPKYTRLKSQI